MSVLWDFYYSVGSAVISDLEYASVTLRGQQLKLGATAGALAAVVLFIGIKIVRPSISPFKTAMFVFVWFWIADLVAIATASIAAFNGYDWQSANRAFLSSLVITCALRIGDIVVRRLYSSISAGGNGDGSI